VWRHAEAPLVESCKSHHISFCRCWECRVFRHPTGHKLHCRHKPMLHKFLQMPSVTVEGVQSCSTMTQGEGRGNTFRTLVFLPICPFLFCCLPFLHPLFSFLSRHREGRRERTTGWGVGTASLEPHGVGGQAVGPSQTQQGAW
jgi:hypothetical protein